MLVNSISPGFVDTKMTRKNNSNEKIKAIKSKIPTGKLVDAAEIASLATYLLLNNKSITGQNIIIDGGYSCGGFEK
jgi:3-oxoacyl-[acyl-carrier protein] reductase